jgi:hypothetical protein
VLLLNEFVVVVVVVVDFVIDSVRKLLDTPSYCCCREQVTEHLQTLTFFCASARGVREREGGIFVWASVIVVAIGDGFATSFVLLLSGTFDCC